MKKLSGPEYLDQAHECMDALVRARREADWPTVVALAEAARAHLEMASFLWQVSIEEGIEQQLSWWKD